MKKEIKEIKKGIVKKRFLPKMLKEDNYVSIGYINLISFEISMNDITLVVTVPQEDKYSNIFTNDEIKVMKNKYLFDDFDDMKTFLIDKINLFYCEKTEEEKTNILNNLLPKEEMFEKNNYKIELYDDIEKVGEKNVR